MLPSSGVTSAAKYRERIYAAYSSARTQSLAPVNDAGLLPRGPYLRRMIRNLFPPKRDARILDVGCGYGALLHFARQAGYTSLHGVDGSPEQVDAARQLGIEGVELGQVMEYLRCLPPGSHDVVVAFDVIEHFTRDELIDLVDEVMRVLKPGGRWILHVPNGESPFGSRILYSDLTHELAFTRISLGQLLIASGFQSVRCFEDEPVPHGVKSAIRYVLWKLVRNTWRFCYAVETGDVGRQAIFSQNLLAVAFRPEQ